MKNTVKGTDAPVPTKAGNASDPTANSGTGESSSGGKQPVEKKSETEKPDGRKTVLKTSEKPLPRTQTTSENGK